MEDEIYGDYTQNQKLVLNILPRITNLVSFGCAACIVYTVYNNKDYRSRVYHRLMVGLSVNMMTLNLWQLWGQAAVPEGTPNVLGARGTTATCSAQGFGNQFGYVTPSYYCALSLYSFVAVRSNFQASQFAWIEKWIHAGVYIYPMVSASYLLLIDAFNFAGYECWIASEPLGCGNGSDVVCTRGPQNIGQIQGLLGALPIIILLLTPTVVMVTLYLNVRKHQSTSLMKAKTVAKQSGLYLLAFYWIYFFSAVNAALIHARGVNMFSMNLLGICVEKLAGFWIFIVYNYLRLDPISLENCDEVVVNDKQAALRKYSFTIFDGTNPSSKSPWAAYVFEGDEDDEDTDNTEAEKWESVIQS